MTTTIGSGAAAEARAAEALLAAGYRIIERNFRCKAGELDIVAEDAGVLAFVEVRSRASAGHGHAAEMVSRPKQRQVARIAEYYLAVRKPPNERVRFDVVAVTGDEVVILKDAWR